MCFSPANLWTRVVVERLIFSVVLVGLVALVDPFCFGLGLVFGFFYTGFFPLGLGLLIKIRWKKNNNKQVYILYI